MQESFRQRGRKNGVLYDGKGELGEGSLRYSSLWGATKGGGGGGGGGWGWGGGGGVNEGQKKRGRSGGIGLT